MLEKIKQSAEYIASKVEDMPKTAVILGTGLGELVNHIEITETIPYSEIPNFPVSTVEGHSGKLIFGKLGNKRVMAMQGRFHYYEGHPIQKVVYPVKVFKKLGVKTLIVTNAAGGINREFNASDLMLITHHQDYMNLLKWMGQLF